MKSNAKQLEITSPMDLLVKNLKSTIINIKEVAIILEITESDVLKLIQNKEIPFVLKDGTYSFIYSDFFIWVVEKYNLTG